MRALLQDLSNESHCAGGRKLQSIFFGGGTPSLFSAAAIETLINAAETTFGFTDDIEITLEANPGTAEQKKFRDFFDAGVNRLSIGVQSFQDRHLSLLGRIHSTEEALRAVEMARKAGFKRVNIDLMHGLPQQTPDDAANDLKQALALAPEHISWYQLTIEPNTGFYSRPPTLPEEDTLADIQEQGQALLSAAGFQQYEISAYAKGGQKSKHNLNYWKFGDYLGIGAGAHSKISSPMTLNTKASDSPGPKESNVNPWSIKRRWKTRHPRHYLDPNRSFNAGEQQLDTAALCLEFMMNALRLIDGVPTALFVQRTGLPLNLLEPALRRQQSRGLMVEFTDTDPKLQATAMGLRFLNTLLESFSYESVQSLQHSEI